MTNDVVNGISVALYENFKDVKIYTDEVPQGTKKPCFFILPLDGFETPLIGDRVQRTMPFVVHYFPKTEKNQELCEVADELYGVLRRIKLLNGDSLNGLKLHHEIDSSILFFYVQFKPILRYVTERATNMGTLDQTVGFK